MANKLEMHVKIKLKQRKLKIIDVSRTKKQSQADVVFMHTMQLTYQWSGRRTGKSSWIPNFH